MQSRRLDSGSALAAIRARVFEKSMELFFVLGAVGTAAVLIRDLVRGAGVGASLVPILAVMMFGILLRMKLRAGMRAHVIVYLGLLLALGISGINSLGVRSPGAIWFLVMAVQAWVLLGGRSAWGVTILAIGGFAFSAWIVFSRGALAGGGPDELARNSWYWAVQGIVLLFVVMLLFQSVRELVLGVAELEREARSGRDRLRSIMDGIDDALLIWSTADGRIVEANVAARMLLGDTGEGGRLAAGLMHLSAIRGTWTPERFAARITETSIAGGPFIWRCRKADGVEFWGEITVSAVTGTPGGDLLISVRDIGDRVRRHLELEAVHRRLEAHVEERTRHLELARQELASFSYSVAHDLRSPLRAMSGYARVLQEDCAGSLSDDDKARAEAIISLAGELASQLDELLAPYMEMSRKKRGEMIGRILHAPAAESGEALPG